MSGFPPKAGIRQAAFSHYTFWHERPENFHRVGRLPANSSPDRRHGGRPLSKSESVRDLLIQRQYRGTLYWLGIEQFNTIGLAKVCSEINNAIALRSRDRGARPPD